jgi:hypothetical protein
MLRVLVVLVVAVAALWYFTRDSAQQASVIEDQVEQLETARAGVDAAEQAAAAMAAQSDAVRDEVMGGMAQKDGE